MNKRYFFERMRYFVLPSIEEMSVRDYPFLSCFLVITDSKWEGTICTESVKLTRKEYESGDFSKYYEREKKLKLKYLRWMKYFFGNKFQNKTSLLSFYGERFFWMTR